MPTILQKRSKASLSSQPREFEGIQKQYKNSAGAMNPYRILPPHLQLSQASHISVCPKSLCFKGILEPLLVWEKTCSEATRQFLQVPLSMPQHQWRRQMPACNRQLHSLVWHQGGKLSSISKLDSGNQLGTNDCHF